MTRAKKTKICPECGSKNVAEILRGMPAFDEQLEKDIEEGRIVFGGCCILLGVPQADYHCNECGCEFGDDPEAYEYWKACRLDKLRGVIYGAAVGDALGVPFEFKGRDSFECIGMTGHGTYDVPEGTFSDDTSMLLATQDSLRDVGYVDTKDMRKRFRKWLYEGAYTADGKVFDVGNATATALDQGYGCSGERSNGNGSLMRIAPLAFTSATDNQIREVSAITHAHDISTTACVTFVHILRDVLDDGWLPEAIRENVPADEHFAFMESLEDMPRSEVRSGGYVIETLGSALWCALRTDDYASCVLAAVNLGHDTDTTACVAGALAGAMYGFNDIPEGWIAALRGKEVIESCLVGKS